MNKYYSIFLILFITLVSSVPIAFAQKESIPKIGITATNNNLQDVLQTIQKKSGILFEITEELKEKPITVTITASNWTTAVRKLLDGFNYVEMLNNDGTLKKAWIMGRTDTTEAVPQEPPLLLPPTPDL